MKKVGLVYSDVFLGHEMPPFHPESRDRLITLIQDLEASELWESLIHLDPESAEEADIARVHDRQYIEAIKQVGTGYLDADTYVSEGTLKAALYACGAAITAVKKCQSGEIERAFCAVRPPGHHADKNRAMGFCIFNNIAVGARFAQENGFKKVFIADFDVHHGNGTQSIFYDENTVFYFSTHQYPHYPGTGNHHETGIGKGEGFTFNIPMFAGAGDQEMMSAYQEKLPQLVSEFSPDLMMVSAGYDCHRLDSLASLSVSDEGILEMIRGILDAAVAIPVIFLLEGGYNLDALSRSVQNTIKELLYR